MKELERRSFYQPAQISQGFQPVRAADTTPLLRENQRLQLAEQQAFADASMQDMRTKRESLKYQELIENEDVASLAKFSKTLTEFGTGVFKDYVASREASMKQLFLEDQQARNDASVAFNAAASQLSDQALEDHKLAVQAAKDGAAYDTTQRIRNLSGWDKHFYSIQAAKNLGERYGDYYNSRVDEGGELTLPTSQGDVVIKIQNPRNPAEQAAVRNFIKGEFLKTEAEGVSPALFAEYAEPFISKFDQKVAKDYRKFYEQNETFKDTKNAFNMFEAKIGKDPAAFPILLDALSIQLDKKGQKLGYKGAWELVETYFKDLADSGADVSRGLEVIKDTPIPGHPKGKTYGEDYRNRFNKLEQEIADERRTNFRNNQTDGKQQLLALERNLLDNLPDDATDADYELAQETYMAESERLGVFDGPSSNIKNHQGLFSEESVIRQAKIEQYEFLQARGELDPAVIMREDLEIQRKFLQIAQQQESQRQLVSKPHEKSIEGIVKENSFVKVLPDGSTKGLAALVISNLKSTYRRRAQEIYATNEEAGYQAAADQALAEIKEEFEQGVKDPGSKYYVKGADGFTNILPGQQARAANSQQVNERIRVIDQTFQALGTSALTSPGLFGDEEFFKRIEENHGKPGWRVPPTIGHFSERLNVSPFQIINEARKALGMTELPAYTQLIEQSKEATPEYRRFVNKFLQGRATSNQLQRLTGGTFDIRPSMQGLVATNPVHKFRKAIIAQESGGSYTIVNPDSGAIGVGQVMPENVGPWTAKYVGRRMTPQEFRYNAAAQDMVINGRFNDMLNQQMEAGYNEEQAVRRAAAEWYSGQPDLWNNTRPQYSNGRKYPSISEYTASIWAKYQSN